MTKFIAVLLSLLITISIHAQSMNATFLLDEKQQKALLPGEIFKGRIQLLPHDGVNLERYQKMVGMDFLEYFYTVSIEKIALNKNNIDVLEIFGTFIAKAPFQKNALYIWTIGAENLPISIKGITVINEGEGKGDPKKDKYIIAEQPYYGLFEMNWFLLIIVLMAGTTIVALFVAIFKKRNARKKATADRTKRISEWHEVFNNCDGRCDYENIYLSRSVWLELLDEELQDIEIFFELIEKCQYQKEWDDIDQTNISSSFDKIREVFGQKYGI